MKPPMAVSASARCIPDAFSCGFSSSMNQNPAALRLSHITKRFGSLTANDDISLELASGEVLALLGENGAGKSTLVSILFGHYVADGGSIEVFGQPLAAGDPKAALAAGVGMVHQHFALADNLSVLDNIMLGTESLWLPFSRRRPARARLIATAQRFGLGVDPDARVGTLSVGERQRVEILKALYRGAKILILDEPTAVLTPQEAESLFATLGQLLSQGLAIIFISHKLDEVLRVSQRIAILRAGKLIATRNTADTSKAELAELMVGRSVSLPQREARPQGETVLKLEGVRVASAGRVQLEGLDLDVRAGEIVGIAGVSGNGQLALAQLLCGTLAASAGRVTIGGEPMPASPREWVAKGVARIPEDRHAVGIVGDLPVWENAVSERLHTPAFSRWGVVRRKAARAFARTLVERFDVRLPGIESPTRVLSGGNMQKLILGRALSVGGEGKTPRFIIANQPTWGLDIGAVAYVHSCLLDAAAKGAAVLLISEDLDELFAIADRIGVMFKGHLGAPRPTETWSLPEIGLAMAGSQQEGASHAA